jgi:ech hydrogenase subunit E
MAEITTIPFGPQHPVLPEPVHLDLELKDEKVVRAVPSIGYVHRGLEKLVEKRDFKQFTFVAERVCGICSFGHGWGYVKAVEGLMQIEVPHRASYLRTLWHELSRIHSHLLWLGLAADAMGFESLFMHAWRLREIVLDLFEETTGGRVIFSVCAIGGVRRDLTDPMKKDIAEKMRKLRKELRVLSDTFVYDSTIRNRLQGIGVLTAQDAVAFGCLGPMARASGVPLDYRCADDEGAYKELGFRPVTKTGGDCLARVEVRLAEVEQSIDLVLGCLENLPEGPIAVPVKGFPPKGEYFTRVEQPRGEAVYYVKGNGTKNLERFRLRTPTNGNLPGLVHILQGCDLADVPNIILTIDPCISCCER